MNENPNLGNEGRQSEDEAHDEANQVSDAWERCSFNFGIPKEKQGEWMKGVVERLHEIQKQSKKLHDIPGLELGKAIEIIIALYGEPITDAIYPYFRGRVETAESWPMECASGTILRYKKNLFHKLIVENIKDRVVIEIGPSKEWVKSALLTKRYGAKSYIGIDIDEKAIRRPDLDCVNPDYQVFIPEEDRLRMEGLQNFAYPIVDDPINFLSKLEDHSAVIISSWVFNEPMNKNQDYRDELEKMINDKTLFGAHEYGPGYSPDLFINSNRLEGFQVSIYRDVPGGENKV